MTVINYEGKQILKIFKSFLNGKETKLKKYSMVRNLELQLTLNQKYKAVLFFDQHLLLLTSTNKFIHCL